MWMSFMCGIQSEKKIPLFIAADPEPERGRVRGTRRSGSGLGESLRLGLPPQPRSVFCAWAILLFTFVPASFAVESRLADAAEKSDRAGVRALLKRRVDVNAPQVDGMTALHWAA